MLKPFVNIQITDFLFSFFEIWLILTILWGLLKISSLNGYNVNKKIITLTTLNIVVSSFLKLLGASIGFILFLIDLHRPFLVFCLVIAIFWCLLKYSAWTDYNPTKKISANIIISNFLWSVGFIFGFISSSTDFYKTLFDVYLEKKSQNISDLESFMPFFAFNHHMVFNMYNLFFKILIIFSTMIIICASARYILKHNTCLMEFPIIILLCVFFLCVLVSANDFMVNFIAIIGFSLNIYVLILTDSRNHISREAAIKYYYLSAFSSGLIAFGIWAVYLLTISTNFVDVSWFLQIWDFDGQNGMLMVMVYFLCFGFFFKLAAFPCHLWTPAVYQGSPQTIMALFILPIKIAMLAFIFKLFINTLKDLYFIWSFIFWFSSLSSMLFGALYAAFEKNLKKFLAYSSINQMGFLLMGLVGGTISSIQASIFYLFIYIIMNLGLFIILLSTYEVYTNRSLTYLTDLHYLAKNNAVYSVTLVIVLFSMAGIPPLGGFFAKYFVFLEIFQQNYYTLVIFGMVTSLISTFYYLKLIKFLWFNRLRPNLKFIIETFSFIKIILFIVEISLVFTLPTINIIFDIINISNV